MHKGITYDDVLLVPQYSDIISRKEVDLTTDFKKGWIYNINYFCYYHNIKHHFKKAIRCAQKIINF